MNDAQLLRYSRHVLLDEIGIEGQQRLLAAHVAIVGAGGLGSPAALYLAAAGIGRITLVDDDVVDLGNLQRQIAHAQERVGQAKVASAALALKALNNDVRIDALATRLDERGAAELAATADVLLDCSDNFATRQLLNRAAVAAAKPLVAAAAIRMDGQISVYDPRRADSPCYACIFAPTHAVEDVRCASMGVLGPLVGILGSMQACEAIRLVVAGASSLTNRLLMLHAWDMEWSEVRVRRDPDCPVCGASAHSYSPA